MAKKPEPPREEVFSTVEVIEEFRGHGLQKDGLYYYDRRLLEGEPASGRATTRQARTYTADQIEALSAVLRCEAAGFSLKKIKERLGQPPESWDLLPFQSVLALAEARRELMWAALVE